MQTLSIDIETYSDVNLSKCGVYKYAESPDFEILLFGYSADGSEVTVIDLAQGERLKRGRWRTRKSPGSWNFASASCRTA